MYAAQGDRLHAGDRQARVPVLATYGTKDTVALPIAGEHIVEVCKRATGSFYEGAGHAPFLEDPERFNRELADFARKAQAERRTQASRKA